MNFKSGFVALIGRPNVGKSTLLNALIGNKVSIISSIPQTTRHQIKGILNLEQAQIVFVDTPGMHNFKDPLAAHLNTIARRSLEGVDLILYVVDTTRAIGNEEKRLMNLLSKQDIATIMVLNKTDANSIYLNDYINFWQNSVSSGVKNPLLYYIPVSAKKGDNIGRLRDAVCEQLPEAQPFYDNNTTTDFPLNFRIADIIREKLFLRLKKELPHSLAVEASEIEDKAKVCSIKATIYVQRNSQKKIVIGKKAQDLKTIGTEARVDIEKIVGKKVFLDIWVTVLGDWQKRPRILKKLGYWWV